MPHELDEAFDEASFGQIVPDTAHTKPVEEHGPMEAVLQTALKNSPITVYQQDRDLRYTWIYNPLSAFTPETIIGKTDADFVSPEEAKRLMELKRHVLTSGQSVREEVRVTSSAGVNTMMLT